MAEERDEPSDNGGRDGRPAQEPLDRDEKVKIALPFEEALRALLETPPEPETAPPKDKRKP